MGEDPTNNIQARIVRRYPKIGHDDFDRVAEKNRSDATLGVTHAIESEDLTDALLAAGQAFQSAEEVFRQAKAYLTGVIIAADDAGIPGLHIQKLAGITPGTFYRAKKPGSTSRRGRSGVSYREPIEPPPVP